MSNIGVAIMAQRTFCAGIINDGHAIQGAKDPPDSRFCLANVREGLLCVTHSNGSKNNGKKYLRRSVLHVSACLVVHVK